LEKENNIHRLVELAYKKKLNDQQQGELDYWIKLSKDNEKEFQKVTKMFEYTDRLTDMQKINCKEDLRYLKQKMTQRNRICKLSRNFQKIAAILIIPFMIGTLLGVLQLTKDSVEISMNKFETAFGVRSQHILSDGTKIWLNSGSKIVYPEKFVGNKREVEIYGEAYFEVEPDKNNPFYVDLGTYKVKVSGTCFNIENYSDEQNISTYLEHGKVDLIKEINGKEMKLCELHEGERAVFNKAKKEINIIKIQGTRYVDWVKGKLVFRNDYMHEVAVRLGRWYNVEILLDGDELENYFFTATFQYETLEQALNLLTYSSPIKYRIISSEQNIDSTFSKRKIIISKK